MTKSSETSQSVSEVIQPERFSSFSRLIRVTALVLKFIRKVKRMETQPDLNMQEIIAAEHLWYKEMQLKLDEKEKSSAVWRQLGVFKDAKVGSRTVHFHIQPNFLATKDTVLHTTGD